MFKCDCNMNLSPICIELNSSIKVISSKFSHTTGEVRAALGLCN